ncbi:MAG TPA: N-acetylmuramoyl-L-alanine amidase [Candidatus Sumerlaeota bacterium]|nr:N-acetylmuramoyl-L-alanine amidase [Candidatus Sumerlaeota bacterium]HNM46864.1 N-acetylmuramoyl-L-alanine amidase [Candidatus Sumerlaeota bacterium]
MHRRSALLRLLVAMAILFFGVGEHAATGGSNDNAWRRRIIIDPGHGGHHKGGIGRINGREVYEKDVTIRVGERLEKLLLADPRFEVRVTRRKDVYVGLRERTQIATEQSGDLFVSLHCNAVPSSSRGSKAKGFEIWTWNSSGSVSAAGKALAKIENEEPGPTRSPNNILNRMMFDALESHALESKRVASAVRASMDTHPYFRANDRGIDSARFTVLEVYDMPSILIELGFMTHPQEVKMLFDPEWQNRYAQLIYQGIVRYYQTTDSNFPTNPSTGRLLSRAH